MDLPGHGLSLWAAVGSDPRGDPSTPWRGAPRGCRGGGDACLLVGDGFLTALRVPPQVGLAAHQQHRDALAEVVHLRVPLRGGGRVSPGVGTGTWDGQQLHTTSHGWGGWLVTLVRTLS